MSQGIWRFFLLPASPRPLVVLRIGLALTLLLQAWSVSSDLFDLFGSGAILQGPLAAYDPQTPFGISYWLDQLSRLGIPERSALMSLFLMYVAALLAMLLGWKTRAAVALVWLFQMLLTHAQTTSYGLDQFAHTALFLLIWMPGGASFSLDCRRHANCDINDWRARLSLRTLQIWLCLAYLASGLTKAVGYQWWNGEAIWRALMLPTYLRFNMAWLADYPWLPRLAALGTLVVETGYAFFIWPRLTRRLWVCLTIGLHLGIAIFLKLHLFGLVMIVLTLSVFGVSAEPRGNRPMREREEGSPDIVSRLAAEERLSQPIPTAGG